jgi:hypothetical protein
MIGRAALPSTAHGEPGRLPSIWPTSNDSTNVKHLEGVVRWVVPMLLPPPPATTIDRLGTALNNLALTAANNITVLQQLTASSLALSMLVTMLTLANKKLAEALANAKLTRPPAAASGTPRPAWSTNTPFPGKYCWTQGHQCSQHHTSVTCGNKAASHKDNSSASNTMGGSNANKGWNTRT